jgi:hypothetical protein
MGLATRPRPMAARPAAPTSWSEAAARTTWRERRAVPARQPAGSAVGCLMGKLGWLLVAAQALGERGEKGEATPLHCCMAHHHSCSLHRPAHQGRAAGAQRPWWATCWRAPATCGCCRRPAYCDCCY